MALKIGIVLHYLYIQTKYAASETDVGLDISKHKDIKDHTEHW